MIGANSVVNRSIPPRCLAVGFPARVVSKAPDFPREVSEVEKVAMFDRIVDEMLTFFSGSGLSCQRNGESYVIGLPRRNWWERRAGAWRLKVVNGDLKVAEVESICGEMHSLLSLRAIPADVRGALAARDVKWIDVANKEHSRGSSDLIDEVLLFLKRYGVRTLRAD